MGVEYLPLVVLLFMGKSVVLLMLLGGFVILILLVVVLLFYCTTRAWIFAYGGVPIVRKLVVVVVMFEGPYMCVAIGGSFFDLLFHMGVIFLPMLVLLFGENCDPTIIFWGSMVLCVCCYLWKLCYFFVSYVG